jgi:hypothetical protein
MFLGSTGVGVALNMMRSVDIPPALEVVSLLPPTNNALRDGCRELLPGEWALQRERHSPAPAAQMQSPECMGPTWFDGAARDFRPVNGRLSAAVQRPSIAQWGEQAVTSSEWWKDITKSYSSLFRIPKRSGITIERALSSPATSGRPVRCWTARATSWLQYQSEGRPL